MPAATDRVYRLLVVDDERNLREGTERILSREGYEVRLAAQGEEALSLLADQAADVVLLDLKMPGLDGLQVLENIVRVYPDTLVIIVTGFATIETAIEAMKKGAYDFMTKPFRPDQLRLAVARALEHIRLREERDRLSAEREAGLWAITTEKSRLRTVVDAIIPGIIITERDKRIVMCNPSFHQMTRIGPAGVTGKYLRDWKALRVLDEMMDHLLEGRTDPDGGLTREFVIEGERDTYIRATVNTVVSDTSKILGLVAVLRNITQAKELEKEKEAFVAMLTHELRSPLGAVDTQFHVVLKGLAGELTEKQRDMFTRMRERVKNVLAMINDLLDLSRIETRQFSKEKKALNLAPIIEETIEILRAQAAAKEQKLEVRLAENLPEVLGDEAALKHVTVNLVSNAIKYTPPGGCIEVEAGAADGLLVFKVADNGLGIPK
ncbi:MAG: response regulator, partial [Thermodesulfobacteriota bacterium]